MSAAGTSQGNQWGMTGQLNINSTTDNPVNCVKFDPFEELVWCGSTTGKVSSFVPSNTSRYSAFVASRKSPIHCIEITDNTIFSLTDAELRINSRQGVHIGKFTSPAMTRMTACRHLPNTSNFLMGGRQSKLIQFDFVHEKEIRTVDIVDSGAVMIRENGTSAFTADDSGNIQQRSLSTMDVVHTYQCHGERVLDFDVQGNKMITVGVSANFSRMKTTDQFVKVYDVRNQKALPPIGLSMPPKYLRFIPSYTERVCIVFQMPGPPHMSRDWVLPTSVRIFDLNSPAVQNSMIQMDTTPLTAFDISSSKSFIAIGTVSGIVGLYSNRQTPLVNENSEKTMFIQPPAQPPVSFGIDETSQSFGLLPLPFSVDPLASDWPAEFTEPVYRRMYIPKEYQNVKQVHYASQIPNPRVHTRLRKHNIVPYILNENETMKDCHVVPAPESAPRRIRIPKLYRKCPQSSTPSPFSHRQQLPEDYTWNIIQHVTMESTFDMNLLANPLIHVFYALSPLKSLILSHVCQEENCVKCELHFLFRAFKATDDQKRLGGGKVKTQFTTTNLAWALARNGIRLTNVFDVVDQILTLLVREVNDETLKSRYERKDRCTMCGAQQQKRVEMEAMLRFDGSDTRSFVKMVESALHLKKGSTVEQICEDCNQTADMQCSRQVCQLSPLLLINTVNTDVSEKSDGFLESWRRSVSCFEKKPDAKKEECLPETGGIEKNKPCRFGKDCRTKKCLFSHGAKDLVDEQSNLLEHVDFPGWAHFIPKRIGIQVYEGTARVSDLSELPEYDEPGAEVYELDAIVAMISDGAAEPVWTHPVSLLREDSAASTAWTLVNELLVSRLHDHEARRIDAQWKVPVMLAYKKRGFERAVHVENIPDEWFFAEKNLSERMNESPAIRDIQELPGKGDIVGIDCEFIKIRTNLLDFNGDNVDIKEIGRASCVNATGDTIIFDDHVRLGDGFHVTDYLTKYSGIVEDHLNPAASDKYLTSHKRLLLRMHVLVQRGVIFVGHALHNDFTVLNVHIVEPQSIDTVNLLRSDDRLLSLAFITRHLLGEEIQVNSHDSVIDARYALKIYLKYLEIKESGCLDDEKKRLFSIMLHESVKKASPLCISTTQKANDKKDSAPKSC